MALQQVIDSVNPMVPAPADARLTSLSRTKEEVDAAFMIAIDAFIDSLIPAPGSQMLDYSVNLHGAAIFGGYGQPMDGTRDSFKKKTLLLTLFFKNNKCL